MNILLTGSGGFIGSAILRHARNLKHINFRPVYRIRKGGRKGNQNIHPAAVFMPDFTSTPDWASAMADIDVVIHAAAHVHVLSGDINNATSIYRKVNFDASLNLARQAAGAGVKRFIFISTVKVNGEKTEPGKLFSSLDTPSPSGSYARSKMEAEEALLLLAKETGMEVVIIRPVLVYGPGVKANFHNMMLWLNKGLPLPFGAINNKRSLVSLDNLVDFIFTCVEHPAAANEIFMVSDGEDLSTTQLLKKMSMALGRPARLIPLPQWMVKGLATLFGKKHLAQRLCDSLQVDITKNYQLLGWRPNGPVGMALQQTADHFLENQ